MIEKRVTELETKSAYQEDTVQTLNDMIYQQQQQITQLQKTCKHLLERIQSLPDNNHEIEVDEIPPHY